MLCAKVAELVLPMANKSGGGGGGSKSDEARVRDVGVPLAAVLDARLQPRSHQVEDRPRVAGSATEEPGVIGTAVRLGLGALGGAVRGGATSRRRMQQPERREWHRHTPPQLAI